MRRKDQIETIPVINTKEPFLASFMFNRVKENIIEFENGLDEKEEVGARLVNFGESFVIHVDDIGYANPNIIYFYGRDSQGQEVQLIQHINQLSILLIKVKRTDLKRKRVGYKLSHENK